MAGCARPTLSAPCASLESPERLAELARGLAYWAARYQDVPGPDDPVRDVGRRRRARRACRTGVPAGTASSSSPCAASTVTPSSSPPSTPSMVRRSDVDALLAAAGDEVVAGGAGDPIVYVHTLTPTAAIRQVADLVDAAVVDLVLGCAWRAIAALVSTYRLPPCRPVAGCRRRRRRATSSIGPSPAATSTPSRSPRPCSARTVPPIRRCGPPLPRSSPDSVVDRAIGPDTERRPGRCRHGVADARRRRRCVRPRVRRRRRRRRRLGHPGVRDVAARVHRGVAVQRRERGRRRRRAPRPPSAGRWCWPPAMRCTGWRCRG